MMADRSLLYRIRAAIQGGFVAVAQEIQLLASYVGLLNGVSDVESALRRVDGTGIGSSVFTFTGNFAAQSSNIADWFGNRQLTRLRCTDNGGLLPPTFTLPGASALNTAFDQLVTAGLDETITFVIEYTGPTTTRLRVIPRTGTGNPVIQGTTSILIASGIAATVEITRTSGTLSDYIFRSIGGLGEAAGTSGDEFKFVNPATDVWNANDGGTLPTQVVKGNAYQVANAPSDGSGRFGEVMEDGDWVAWTGETFTSWSAEPHQWIVIPSHEVRRISALEDNFLSYMQQTPESDRNDVVRGANYADSAGEIRMKLYSTRAGYSPSDLNTTGQIDQYTNASDQSGFLGIRLSGTQATVASTLPTLYVYSEDNGTFTRLVNMSDDFTYEGDFGAESDYLTREPINYSANDTLRIYVGSKVPRYNNPNLDINESNLSDAVQSKLNSTHPSGNVDEQRLATLESKVDALYPLTPDVTQLDEWAEVIGPRRTIQEVDITTGYTKIADFRDDSTRYESSGVVYATGTNVVTYTGLGDNLYRTFGFKVTAPADQVLMWIVDGSDRIPFVDMTGAGNFRINAYREAIGEDQVITNQAHFLTKDSGPATLGANDGNVQTFTITNFPANATHTSRVLQIGTDVYVNGVDTGASHLLDIEIPATNTAQAKQTVSSSTFLGPLHGNRTVVVEVGYEYRVSGSNLVVDLSISSAPSDVTIDMADVATLLNYTAPGATSRVDNFIAFTDPHGTYTFTGENEILITFQPSLTTNSMETLGAVVGTGAITELNDIRVPVPAHSFESVEIPDTIDFRTFSPVHFLRHSDLLPLLNNRNVQWCYGLATLLTVRELSITSAVDFFQPTENGNRLVSRVEGTTAPNGVVPQFIGQLYIDTTNKNAYIATDTASDGDWLQINS